MKRLHEMRRHIDVIEQRDTGWGIGRLIEIKEEIKGLVNEAIILIKYSRNMTALNRAQAYWVGHILLALDNESNYVGLESRTTMQSTIDELSGGDQEDAYAELTTRAAAGENPDEIIGEIADKYRVKAQELADAWANDPERN